MLNANDLTPQAIRALSQVPQINDGQVITALEDALSSVRQKLVYAGDMVLIHRLQGKAQAIEELLQAIKDSTEVVRRS